MIESIRAHVHEHRPETFTFVGATLSILLGCAVPFWLPLVPASMALVAGVAGGQLLAYMAYFRFSFHRQQTREDSEEEGPEEEASEEGDTEKTGRSGSRLLYALPVVGAVCALPASVAGRIDLDVDGVFELVLIMLLLGALAIPLAGVALALVWAPVELLVRGVLRLLRGRRDGLGYVAVATVIGAVTAFAVVGASAVDTSSSPSQRSRFQGEAIAALFGRPGDYTVADPTLLIVARVLGAFLVLVLVAVVVAALWDKVREMREAGRKDAKSEAPASGAE